MFKKLYLLLPLLPKLGYYNVAYMVWYRLSMKMGWRKKKFPIGEPVHGPFYRAVTPIEHYPEAWRAETLARADRIIAGELTWFHYHRMKGEHPPNWFRNPFDGSVLSTPQKHWTELGDFDLNTGDIKILWEPSRMDWFTDLARAYRISGEEKYLSTINDWIRDWSTHNPVNRGPNWKCGQETAIRIMKLITVAQILDQDNNAMPGLVKLIRQHVERVTGNITYAIVQNNNHGTSEAAGMYIGALWLIHQENNGKERQQLIKWKDKGRHILENRILHLIASRGTFSQHSVNYHRVVVDTMSWVLYAMERYGERGFSPQIMDRLEKLGEWQYKMTVPSSGDAPNIGANDGAMLETLHGQDYRDFRPSTQLFFGILKKHSIYTEAEVQETLFWRYPDRYSAFPVHSIQTQGAEILDRAFVVFQNEDTKIVVRIPTDRFRPSASDAFHLDLWHQGENLLGDSGSFSYNAGAETDWYKSVQAHNTVQIGDGQQMPKISRFLYGSWLREKHSKPLTFIENRIIWTGAYTDYRKNSHSRTVEWDVTARTVVVTDEIRPDGDPVISLFWHLNAASMQESQIAVTTGDETDLIPEVTTSSHSLYYLEKRHRRTMRYTTRDSKITTIIRY